MHTPSNLPNTIVSLEQRAAKKQMRYVEKAPCCQFCSNVTFYWREREDFSDGRPRSPVRMGWRCSLGKFKVSTKGVCLRFERGEPTERAKFYEWGNSK